LKSPKEGLEFSLPEGVRILCKNPFIRILKVTCNLSYHPNDELK